MTETGRQEVAQPTLGEATGIFAQIGLLSFGGPAAQIALMHREIVERRGWLSERGFLDALSFCTLLPGPEAMQLATYAGWRLHGTLGGLIAGGLFVLPGAVVILVLAALYAQFGQLPLMGALFLGIKAAVLVIVIEALLRVSRKALTRPAYWVVAGFAFAALFVFDAPFPVVILLAGLWGFLGHDGQVAATETAGAKKITLGRTIGIIALWLFVWWAPLLALELLLPGHVLGEIGRFFSILATVTFGGAYAVLAYMAQTAVSGHGWLTAAEMTDALGLAETTPGPLILVTEFVGFLAAARAEGGLSFLAGTAGAAVTLWATFAPCFLWVFAGAPYVAKLRTVPRLRGALDAITAAVVGVILNLSLWFALQVGFGEVTRRGFGPVRPWMADLASLDWRVPILTLVAGALLLGLHRSVLFTLAACALAGLGLGAAFPV